MGIAVRNRPVEVENVLYTTLQPAAPGAELKHGTLVTVATWASAACVFLNCSPSWRMTSTTEQPEKP